MIIIKGGTLVTPVAKFDCDIAVDGEKIARVEPNIAVGLSDDVIDASSALVFPGFIDAHTHFDMDSGNFKTADDFSSGTAAAILGGTTTIVDYACQTRGDTLDGALKQWHDKADASCFCDYGFHMSITDWNRNVAGELSDMVAKGVTSFKLYMAYDNLRLSDDDILDILYHMKSLGAIMCVHCENGRLVNYLVSRLKAEGNFSPSAHPLSRPAEVEAEAVSRLLYMSRIADWPVNIVHLSSALGLNEIRKARNLGQKAFVETCPQYMLLDDGAYSSEGFEGAKYVCSPPLRKKSDVKSIVEAVISSEINTISTDHCGYYFKSQKTRGINDFSAIPNGLPGVEFRPGLIYGQFVKTGLMTAEQMCEKLSANPAKLYGMYPRKGAVLPGSDADIVIWRDKARKVDSSVQNMKCDYSPYEGMDMSGEAETVLLRGKTVVKNAKLAQCAMGNYIHRGLPLLNDM